MSAKRAPQYLGCKVAFDHTNRAVLVTGATRGLGMVVTRAFIKEGARASVLRSYLSI